MAERRTSYGLPDLLASGHGDLLGPGRAQLPLPPLLMFERIEAISDTGGAHGRGQVVATLDVAGNTSLDWFFSCHFRGDPVMPGSLGLEALWQLTGFYLGWLGALGKGRALGVREVKLTGMVTPRTARIEYVVDIKRVLLRRLKLAIADGVVKADGEIVCAATDVTVGLAEIGAPSKSARPPDAAHRVTRHATSSSRSRSGQRKQAAERSAARTSQRIVTPKSAPGLPWTSTSCPGSPQILGMNGQAARQKFLKHLPRSRFCAPPGRAESAKNVVTGARQERNVALTVSGCNAPSLRSRLSGQPACSLTLRS